MWWVNASGHIFPFLKMYIDISTITLRAHNFRSVIWLTQINITFIHVKCCGRQIHYELGDLPWGKVKKRCCWKFSWFWMTKWLTVSLIPLFTVLWSFYGKWNALQSKYRGNMRSNEKLKYLFVAHLRKGVSISFVIGSDKINWDAKDWRSGHEHSNAFAPPWIFIFIICCWSPFDNIVWSQEISKSHSTNDRSDILKYILV